MSTRPTPSPNQPNHPTPLPVLSWGYLAVILTALAAVMLFGFYAHPWSNLGYLPLAAAVALAWLTHRRLARDLTLIAASLTLISAISLAADISWLNIARMGIVLAASVALPYAISRWVFRDHAVRFPTRTGHRWSGLEIGWLVFVLFVGWLVLPRYFLGSGAYLNWPAVVTPSQIARLFMGVNAVGLWDELFFICTVFTLIRRHFAFWPANLATSVIFVSFLWELGYRAWAPFITIPFALVQAVIFTKTKSLPYTVTVHLLFDLIVFLSIVHAHHPQALPIF